LKIRRGEQDMTLTMPGGRWQTTTRMDISQAALTLYLESREAEKAKRIDDAVSGMVQAAKAAQESGDQSAAGWLYERAGGINEARRKWQDAQSLYEAGWKLLEGSSDTAAQSRLLDALGRCSRNLNDYPSARSWYEHALRLNTAAGNEMWAAANLSDLGNIARSRSDLQAA